MSMTYLALLRGINVGGKNKLPMKDLVNAFVSAGCGDVRTYIQSGNVICRADAGIATRLPLLLTTHIEKRFGYQIPVLLRTTEQIANVIENNPFLEAGAAEDELYVLFLADVPAAHRVDDLDPNRSPLDAFKLRGQEIYLRLPRGVSASKLTNQYFDSRLATTSTGRNWRTVTKLFAMMKT